MSGGRSRQVDGKPVIDESVRRGGGEIRGVLPNVVMLARTLARCFDVVSADCVIIGVVMVVIIVSLFSQHQSRGDASQRFSVLHPVDVTDGRIGFGAAFNFRGTVSWQIQDLWHVKQLWLESDVKEGFSRRGGKSVSSGTIVPPRIITERGRYHQSTFGRNVNSLPNFMSDVFHNLGYKSMTGCLF